MTRHYLGVLWRYLSRAGDAVRCSGTLTKVKSTRCGCQPHQSQSSCSCNNTRVAVNAEVRRRRTRRATYRSRVACFCTCYQLATSTSTTPNGKRCTTTSHTQQTERQTQVFTRFTRTTLHARVATTAMGSRARAANGALTPPAPKRPRCRRPARQRRRHQPPPACSPPSTRPQSGRGG